MRSGGGHGDEIADLSLQEDFARLSRHRIKALFQHQRHAVAAIIGPSDPVHLFRGQGERLVSDNENIPFKACLDKAGAQTGLGNHGGAVDFVRSKKRIEICMGRNAEFSLKLRRRSSS